MSVSNYGELKSTIQGYLYDRKDLVARIPDFISLAERKIFRRLRCPANEKTGTWAPDAGTTLPEVQIPGDYLEAKFLLVNDRPLERISDIQIAAKLRNWPAPQEPRQFARWADKFKFFPPPDSNYPIELVYWYDLSGSLVDDTDTNEILRIAPDLYVYGSCLEATPWLADEDERIPTWREMFNEAMLEINGQTVTAEYSGSPVAVQGSGAD